MGIYLKNELLATIRLFAMLYVVYTFTIALWLLLLSRIGVGGARHFWSIDLPIAIRLERCSIR